MRTISVILLALCVMGAVAQPPTQAPNQGPTQAPTKAPTQGPTQGPTQAPTKAPTQGPTQPPNRAPTLPPPPPTPAPYVPPTKQPCPAVSSQPFCKLTDLPKLNLTTGCTNCKPCTSSVISACNTPRELSFCGPNQVPFTVSSPCCQLCIPPPSKPTEACDASKTPVCGPGVLPSVNSTTGCLVCRAADGRQGDCSESKLKACETVISNLPSCAIGQAPTRDPDTCCISCKPRPAPVCTQAQLDSCRVKVPTLPACAANVAPSFNSSSCCLTCNPNYLPNSVKPSNSSGKACTAEQVKLCAAQVSTCQAGEQSVPIPNSCCVSCLRPQSACSPDTVVKCQQSTRDCVSGETPTFVTGECCPTCRPAPQSVPSCASPASTGSFFAVIAPTGQPSQTGCKPNEVCMRVGSGSTYKAVCKPRKVFDVGFNATDATRINNLRNMTASDFKSFLTEIVSRHCESNTDKASCQLFNKRGTFDGDVASISYTDEGIVGTIVAADAPIKPTDVGTQSNPIFRLMQTSTSTTEESYYSLISTASSDAYANSGYTVVTVSVNDDAGSGSTPSDATSVRAVGMTMLMSIVLSSIVMMMF